MTVGTPSLPHHSLPCTRDLVTVPPDEAEVLIDDLKGRPELIRGDPREPRCIFLPLSSGRDKAR